MTEEERYSTVGACKFVHKVIRNAPMYSTKKFINDNQIHIYAIGEEYEHDENDLYYAAPRKLGMIRVTKRSPGVSTSDLIRRITSRKDELRKRKDKKKEIEGCV